MARESREVWRKRVERWGDSGLTAQQFADEIGVNVHTLSHWKWLLAQEARRESAPTPSAQPVFVELVEPKPSLSSTTAPCHEPFEVVLVSGLRVRVPAAFDAVALRRLVDALGAA